MEVLAGYEEDASAIDVAPPERAAGWLEQLIDALPPIEEPAGGDGRFRPFDPDRDSAAHAISAIEFFLESESKLNSGWFEDLGYAPEKALEWLQETVGLNFQEIETRSKGFPVIAVPHHVSDKYSLDDPRGLYGYLTQVRLACIIGADLAAIALCRATTDLVIRRHYAPDAHEREGLHSLITEVQARPKFKFLKEQDLRGKVKEADGILHAQALGDNVREFPTRYRVLIRDWVKLLEKMIDEAPEGSSDSLPSPVLCLTHIIEAIERIRGEMDGVSLEAFEADWRKRWLVERGVEIISEASLHLSEELKARHPNIPWPKVAGIGNVLRDDYHRAKPDVLWNVARRNLPRLESACRAELAAAGS
jgi:uncharacterized protein with HEPN domain